MNAVKPLKLYTLAEFEAMPREEGWNYELIDGLVLMSPRHSIEHQNIAGNIYFELRNALKDLPCKPIQEVDLVLENNNLIPDLMVICNDKLEGKRYEKPPLIVIEIISPTSASRDHITKRRKYEQLGIREYWIVSPDEKCVTVFNYALSTEEMYCEGQVMSAVLPEVKIDLHHILA